MVAFCCNKYNPANQGIQKRKGKKENIVYLKKRRKKKRGQTSFIGEPPSPPIWAYLPAGPPQNSGERRLTNCSFDPFFNFH
jgi:hypothetical protein